VNLDRFWFDTSDQQGAEPAFLSSRATDAVIASESEAIQRERTVWIAASLRFQRNDETGFETDAYHLFL
jgi:hypothetical protein